MQEFKITRYSFDELSDESKAVAIETEQRNMHEYMPTEYIREVLESALSFAFTGDADALRGQLKCNDWDLSYSQGEHVGIDGEIETNLSHPIAWPSDVTKARFNYHHYYGQQVTLYDIDGQELDDSPAVSKQLIEIEREIKRKGYAAIDDYTSETNAIESLKEAGDIVLESGEVSIPQGITVRA